MIDAQADHGILNKIEKQQAVDDEKVEITIEEPESVYQHKKKDRETVASSDMQEKEEEENSFTVMLDPGHQETGNAEQEPIAPGAIETKPKVSSGTTGVATNKPEYELTLDASFILQEILEEKGFDVILTRSSHQVDISNVERAQMANDENVDLFIRVHADGAENTEVNGFSVLTPSDDNHYTKNIYEDSLLAAKKLVEQVGEKIALHQDGLFFRDDLTGFNWSEVPVVLVELGFMTNPQEDKNLSDDAYLLQLMNLVADGVEAYKEEKEQ